mmetsp:Transcript_32048/g.53618  ORF Transcript_32048/g.53618 Transcript_32048/m.53618 type:complete len:80 (-) Transcript_32048:68-307(-)
MQMHSYNAAVSYWFHDSEFWPSSVLMNVSGGLGPSSRIGAHVAPPIEMASTVLQYTQNKFCITGNRTTCTVPPLRQILR